MTRFIAHFLIVLACWTLLIKFIFPIVFDAVYDHPAGQHIMWDFWWVVHLWLAWALLNRPAYTLKLAFAVSVIEIIIIVGKFWLFLSAPDWNIWQTNWFINKVFVLACFILLLVHILLDKRSLTRSRLS